MTVSFPTQQNSNGHGDDQSFYSLHRTVQNVANLRIDVCRLRVDVASIRADIMELKAKLDTISFEMRAKNSGGR
jgi:hypothetical protein